MATSLIATNTTVITVIMRAMATIHVIVNEFNPPLENWSSYTGMKIMVGHWPNLLI